jgi:septal ring factor EnvC (AmiA/AmiB activator)
MASLSSSATRRLSGANYELTSRRGITNTLLLAGLVLMVLALAGAGVQLLAPVIAPASTLADLRRENAQLREDAERARIELQFERATRSELDRQVAELNERVTQLTTQLEFFNAHSGKKRKTD